MKEDKIKNEKEMEEIENMLFGETVKVTENLKSCIKSMSDIYKEFRKNGLAKDEALALMGVMFGMLKGGNK